MKEEQKKDQKAENHILYKHGNQAVVDQQTHLGHAYVTNALTQYDIPLFHDRPDQESDLAVEDAKRRVDENHK